MAVFSKEEGVETTSDTIIGPSVKVEGNFSGEGNIVVQGTVQGILKTANDITIEDGAKVEADVEAANLKVSGEVTGNVKCHGKTDLAASAHVNGDIETEIISIETGAVLNGRCSCSTSEAPTPASDTEEQSEEE
ncbi:polymer-forming cytoskeletal protein [Patescibacteria group bacterium]|nr:polymer-forming cytoskeletal protein [Patescibacteria group bacterium]MBU1673736.1 polymer-forming cytoskeletal protein [Patescibacteria group bacterium]MBU1963103.1 polymer-forming cytoskeletal protein [Patescibacteria group bacterium]